MQKPKQLREKDHSNPKANQHIRKNTHKQRYDSQTVRLQSIRKNAKNKDEIIIDSSKLN